ncbi:4-hydroxy-tetrahydrodipicolinate synthase [Clostridium beijerinckii]|jgi:4-hydroxy-tetrahydrodipicolinate synthase|uniref:4-hydroxy-tetrahydrodipicolinate synthase n=1 Tax=Clostridium beijerinckii TaxID=1520 RepID=A0A0B5QV44_CLOBE|nr:MULTISPECIES: 4-hydroxy-tetrahydrodipicolinate synthase [Clostridium]ALB44115.1 4-hydroxy-tetrahydrodipicolinate synthase [Clostridium beijerinckii NRRL B-598]AJH01848.1 4-hydroxy-tetrahydrodipicolinate synthase [Clostridium beijerinckii]AQS07639.1 4-hydroxy-tetrahydrodipicolinate synthase [Clostridium beijerinckii]MBA2884267.1 4-hydroxy-tetrahydrodipicolinate synthase [Clostridium beijerinckii]MBA2898336.1 4-hydroxy-tetrahydrodipicolinate synthase [Clostridium beijerinckii]
MKDIIFTGAAVAIVTPFTEDGINFSELKKLIDFNIENGTDAIVIAGTTGESSTMTDEEHREVIRFTVEYVNKRVPVIAGTGSNDTVYAVELSKYAESVGADALLLVTPYYNKTTQTGLIKHYNYIADRVNIPIILYNVPSRTGVNITPETYAELAKHPRIVATKEASGDLSAIAKIKAICKDELNIYSGNDDQIVPILSLGGKGVISVFSNIMPKESHEICSLYFEGKVEESCNLQTKYLDLINTLFIEVNPIPVKTALGIMGYNVGPLRMPLFPMEGKNLEKLREELAKNNLI